MMKSKLYIVIISLLFSYPIQGFCADIKKEITTKFLIQDNDTIVDFITTKFFLKDGTILSSIWEDPLNETKTIDHFSDGKYLFTLFYKHNLKEDSTIYSYDYKGELDFTETLSRNIGIKKSIYSYFGDTIRMDNYELGNNFNYFLTSYQLIVSDSTSNITIVKDVNIEENNPSQINQFIFDANHNLIANKTFSNLDDKKVIYELNYTYKNGLIHEENSVNHEGISNTITFDYFDLDINGNWTKKIASTSSKNQEEIEVGFELRTLEYW